MNDKKPIISVRDVNVIYGDQKVLDGISFDVMEGDYLGIIGPNGGGKTTLLRVILGLLKPDSGSVEINAGRIGYVPQRISQREMNFPATVEEVVRSGGRYGVAADQAMEMTDIVSLKKRIIGELSGGQRQRVFIARALALQPDVLILDEPAVGVDIASQEKFYEFVAELNKKHKLTILFVSHDIDVVAHEATAVLCLNNTLICHTTPEEAITTDYLEKIYGRKVKFILHGH
ncbi:MAG: metal ABC transporter ATP-binding protein [Patescibacteria group bacterium]